MSLRAGENGPARRNLVSSRTLTRRGHCTATLAAEAELCGERGDSQGIASFQKISDATTTAAMPAPSARDAASRQFCRRPRGVGRMLRRRQLRMPKAETTGRRNRSHPPSALGLLSPTPFFCPSLCSQRAIVFPTSHSGLPSRRLRFPQALRISLARPACCNTWTTMGTAARLVASSSQATESVLVTRNGRPQQTIPTVQVEAR